MNYLVNYPDSAQAVASSQFNKHFLSTHYPQCSQWAIVTLPAGGREVIRQIQDAQQEPLLAVGARQELGMVTGAHREPSHLCWQRAPPFLIVSALCSQALVWIYTHGPCCSPPLC